MNTNEKIHTGNISFPEVEKTTAETRTELLETARRDGKYTGLKNIPPPGETSCTPYIVPLKTYAEQKRSAALAILQPDQHIAAIRFIDETLLAQASEITARTKELLHLNDVDRRELSGQSPPQKSKSPLTGWILTIINSLSDLAFNAGAFEALGDSLGYAIGIAAGVALATFVLAKGIVYCMRQVGSGERRWYAYIGGQALVAIGGFSVLSVFRSGQIEASGTGTHVSPLAFLLLNLFFFCAAILIAILFFPNESKCKEDCELSRRFALIKEREDEIKTLREKLEVLKSKADADRRKHMTILSYTVHVMNRFKAIYLEAVAVWKSTNLLCRPDRAMPGSFAEAIPELDPLEFTIPPSLDLPNT